MPTLSLSRRQFLAAGCALPLAAKDVLAADGERPGSLPRLAAVNSIYRLRSHAYHIAGRFIHGYTRDGFHHQPPWRLVRMYNDQQPPDDLGPEVARRHGITLARSVAEALGGKGSLDVDGVLLVCEHGDYPENERGQILYPRFELFEQIAEVFRTSRRSVPVFVDKHLSYDHAKAARMVATAKELGFGLMAGSSIPVTWRQPVLELPLDTAVDEGLVIFGQEKNTVEIYLFHALEGLQCMLERRRGGETGVRSVACLQGAEVWKAGDAGRWSWPLLRAALSRAPSANYGDVRENVTKPLALLIEYRDGTRGTILHLPEQTSDLCFAARLSGKEQPVSTCFYLPPPPGANYFSALTANIEKFLATGKAPYPIERTLLTSTMLDFGMRSRHEHGRVYSEPALDIRYRAPEESGFIRGRVTAAG